MIGLTYPFPSLFLTLLQQNVSERVLGVSSIILNKHPHSPLSPSPLKILLIQREKDPFKSKWCFPGGRLELQETHSEATVREIKEELGLTLRLFNPQQVDYINYQVHKSTLYMVLVSCGFVDENELPETGSESLVSRWFEYEREFQRGLD